MVRSDLGTPTTHVGRLDAGDALMRLCRWSAFSAFAALAAIGVVLLVRSNSASAAGWGAGLVAMCLVVVVFAPVLRDLPRWLVLLQRVSLPGLPRTPVAEIDGSDTAQPQSESISASTAKRASTTEAHIAVAPLPHSSAETDDEFHEEEPGDLPPDVTQQLTRSRSEDGGETIYGVLRAELAPGARQAWLHIAFCPPLPVRPECSAHWLDGPEAAIEIDTLETFGARLVVRLTHPVTTAESVVVEFLAQTNGTE